MLVSREDAKGGRGAGFHWRARGCWSHAKTRRRKEGKGERGKGRSWVRGPLARMSSVFVMAGGRGCWSHAKARRREEGRGREGEGSLLGARAVRWEAWFFSLTRRREDAKRGRGRGRGKGREPILGARASGPHVFYPGDGGRAWLLVSREDAKTRIGGEERRGRAIPEGAGLWPACLQSWRRREGVVVGLTQRRQDAKKGRMAGFHWRGRGCGSHAKTRRRKGGKGQRGEPILGARASGPHVFCLRDFQGPPG